MPHPPWQPTSSELQPTSSLVFEILIRNVQIAHETQVGELQSQIQALQDQLTNKIDAAPPLSLLALPTAKANSDASSPDRKGSTSPDHPSLTALAPADELPDVKSADSEKSRIGGKDPDPQDAFLLGKVGTDVSAKFSMRPTGRPSVVSKAVFPALYVQKVRAQNSKGEMFKARMRIVAESPLFEATSMLVIFLNTLLMLVQTQYEGHGVAYSLDVDGYSKSKEDAWPHMKEVLEISERFFILFFTFELAFRITAYGLQFFKGLYHMLDFVIVVAGWIDWIAGDAFDPTMLRMLRFVRLGRILRSFNNPRFLDALYFLTTSIKSSLTTLLWSLVMLTIIQCIAALTISQFLAGWFADAPKSPESREVFQYYGTFTKAILTMFEILLANWIVPCRVLSNNVGEHMGLLVLAYRCVCGFAVLNVISAVFINQTMKIMSQDTDIMLMERGRAETRFKSNLHSLFSLLDMSNDGHITKDELDDKLQDPEVHMACFSMGMSIHDLEGIMQLCGMDEEGMPIHAFIQAANDIRKQANTLDVARLLTHSMNMQSQMKDIRERLRRMGLRFDAVYADNGALQRESLQAALRESAFQRESLQVALRQSANSVK